MTLLDAPAYNAARERRRQMIRYICAGLLATLFVAWWLVAGRPIDWPWNWDRYWFGRITTNRFFDAVEGNDLAKAYGIWVHDKNWRQHPSQHGAYPFDRFQQDWGPASPDNEYGPIRSHQIALIGHYGNGVLVAVFINVRKDDALDLFYDPGNGTLSFAPPGVKLYLGP